MDFAKLNTEERSLTLEDNFRNYLKYGGLPKIHNLHFKEYSIYQYLDAIYNAVILKDVNERSNIRNTALKKRFSTLFLIILEILFCKNCFRLPQKPK